MANSASPTPSLAASHARPSAAVNVTLWIAQVVLAAMFALAGFLKATTPMAQLHTAMAWTNVTPDALVRFIGFAELAGAVGVLLPAATRIQPRLTPLAAAGLLTVMILAIPFHISRGEWSNVPVPLVLGALAAFVLWGRTRKAPIAPRT